MGGYSRYLERLSECVTAGPAGGEQKTEKRKEITPLPTSEYIAPGDLRQGPACVLESLGRPDFLAGASIF